MLENDEWTWLTAAQVIEMTLYGDEESRKRARKELRRRIELEQQLARG